jgi:hypothetical protein
MRAETLDGTKRQLTGSSTRGWAEDDALSFQLKVHNMLFQLVTGTFIGRRFRFNNDHHGRLRVPAGRRFVELLRDGLFSSVKTAGSVASE